MAILSRQQITPFLWLNGTANKAARFYVSIFKKSKILDSDEMSSEFEIDGLRLIAFNGGPTYKINPAVSLMVSCKTQKEIDNYWSKLSKGGKPLRCGWITDPFGVTWQIVPEILPKLLGDPNPEKSGRAMQAMMKMKKLNIAQLRKAHSSSS